MKLKNNNIIIIIANSNSVRMSTLEGVTVQQKFMVKLQLSSLLLLAQLLVVSFPSFCPLSPSPSLLFLLCLPPPVKSRGECWQCEGLLLLHLLPPPGQPAAWFPLPAQPGPEGQFI